jgi:hypothetical protein
MHWAIDAVVAAATSNGRPKALRGQDQVIIPRAFPARPARSFSFLQEMAFSGVPIGGTSKYSSQAAVGLCGPFLTFLKSAFFSLL